MFTPHGHWYPPAVPGEQVPAAIANCGGQLCPDCAALMNAPIPGLGVLNSPTPMAPSLPSGPAEPLSVPIDDLADWYQRYLELKDAQSKIKDMLDEARSTLLDSIKSRFAGLPAKTNMTIGGRPVLQRQVVVQNRVDTTALKAQRPDVAKEFTVRSEQERLNIL